MQQRFLILNMDFRFLGLGVTCYFEISRREKEEEEEVHIAMRIFCPQIAGQ